MNKKTAAPTSRTSEVSCEVFMTIVQGFAQSPLLFFKLYFSSLSLRNSSTLSVFHFSMLEDNTAVALTFFPSNQTKHCTSVCNKISMHIVNFTHISFELHTCMTKN